MWSVGYPPWRGSDHRPGPAAYRAAAESVGAGAENHCRSLARRRRSAPVIPEIFSEIAYPAFLHPIIFTVPVVGVPIRWYGLMFLLGFAIGRQLLRAMCRRGTLRMPIDRVDDMLVTMFLGMVVGARVFYMFVYYRAEPGEPYAWTAPFQVWKGGLAFHGGAIGILAAMAWFARSAKVRFASLADALALSAGPGIFFGRIGNFINAELYGRPTDVPWAMRFPDRDDNGAVLGMTPPVHPSQLYEAIGEGLLGMAFIWSVRPFVRYQGQLIGLGLAYYGLARFVLEFFRQPDSQLGLYGGFSMGQILCGLTVGAGVAVFALATRRAVPVDQPYPADEPAGSAPATATAA